MKKPVHLAKKSLYCCTSSACGGFENYSLLQNLPLNMTYDPKKVTCKRCRETTTYKTAKGYYEAKSHQA